MELTESKFLKHSEDQQVRLVWNHIASLKQSIYDLEILYRQLVEAHEEKKDTNYVFMTIANICTNYIDKENRTAFKYIRFYQMGQNRKQ